MTPTSDHVATSNGVPVLLQLEIGPHHPIVPKGVFALSIPLTREMVDRARERTTEVVEALATLTGDEAPDLTEAFEDMAGEGDRIAAVDPFELCWN